MKKPYKLVYVEWEDSLGCSSGWSHLDETAAPSEVEPLMARSVGFLYRESGSSLTLVPHLVEEMKQTGMQGMGVVTIPKSAIRKRRGLNIFEDDKLTTAGRRVMRRKSAKPGKPPPGSSR